MNWGISPKKTATVPLGDFGVEKYLAIVFKACENLNWKVSYVNNDGLITYTPISWASFSEQITVIIKDNVAHIKTECVGYQIFLFDFGKNEKNLELLIAEIEYVGFHIKTDLDKGLQEFKNHFYQHPGISLSYTPLGAKEFFTHLGTIFIPKKNYLIVPWLIIINCFIFILQRLIIAAYSVALKISHQQPSNSIEKVSDFSKTIFAGIERDLVLHGEYWRLVAACFSHVSLTHLFSNMIFLAYIGSIIEGRVGKWNFLGLYILTGICASIASIAYRYEGMGVGASGAIMGLFGVFLAYLSTSFFDKNARRAFLISTILICVLVLIPKSGPVDNAAHLGGFVSGYFIGLFSFWAYSKTEKNQQYLIRGLSYTLFIAMAVSLLAFIPRYDLPKFRESKSEIQNNLSAISAYFYSEEYRGISRQQKITLLEQKALPLIRTNRILLKEVRKVSIPSEEQKEANLYFDFYDKKLKIYELLYKEYKTENSNYRKEIEKLTEEIRNLSQQTE
jgi:rhomboid protease GluP